MRDKTEEDRGGYLNTNGRVNKKVKGTVSS